jgi:hypothetical protein
MAGSFHLFRHPHSLQLCSLHAAGQEYPGKQSRQCERPGGYRRRGRVINFKRKSKKAFALIQEGKGLILLSIALHK